MWLREVPGRCRGRCVFATRSGGGARRYRASLRPRLRSSAAARPQPASLRPRLATLRFAAVSASRLSPRPLGGHIRPATLLGCSAALLGYAPWPLRGLYMPRLQRADYVRDRLASVATARGSIDTTFAAARRVKGLP